MSFAAAQGKNINGCRDQTAKTRPDLTLFAVKRAFARNEISASSHICLSNHEPALDYNRIRRCLNFSSANSGPFAGQLDGMAKAALDSSNAKQIKSRQVKRGRKKRADME